MQKNKSDELWLIPLLKKVLPIVGLTIFLFILYYAGPEKILSTLLKISPWILIIVILMMIPRLLLNNYIWQIILKKQKICISFFKSLKIMVIGNFYRFITPGRLGMYAKVLYLKDETNEPTGKLFINLVIQNAVDTYAYFLVLLISAILYASEHIELFLFVVIYIFLVTIFFLYFLKRERGEKAISFLIKIFIPKKLKVYLNKFSETFYKDFIRVRDLIYPFMLSLIIQIIEYSQLYIIALSIGITLSFPLFIILYTLATTVAYYPSLFGIYGTKEAALILFFTPFDIAVHKIVALSLASFIVFGVLIGLIGFILALFDAKNNRKILKIRKVKFD